MILTQLTKSDLKSLSQEIDLALVTIKEKYGLSKLTCFNTGGSIGLGEATLKLNIEITKDESVNVAEIERGLELFGIPKDAHTRKLIYKKRYWTIVKVDLGKAVYNILMKDSDGKTAGFTPLHVKSLLQQAG